VPHLTNFTTTKFSFELPHTPEGSRVSCVIGANGSGKSQLLRAIVDAAENDGPQFDISDDSVRQLRGFSQVLAISNLVADVFPSTKQINRYRYLGVRQATNWTGTKAVESLTIDSVLLCLRDPSRLEAFQTALQLIGYSRFEVTVDPEGKTPRGRPRSEANEKRGPQAIDQFGASVLSNVRAIRPGLGHDMNAWRNLMSDLEIASSESGVDFADGIAFLRKRGELLVALKFYRGEREESIDELSAGQLLVISLAARLAAHVRNGTLVLIDEPEIGLHPTWQAAVAPLLRILVPRELDAHIIVATHSPHVVVDADDVLHSSERWGVFEPFDEALGGRSVENILYRVFGARVVGNKEVEDDLTLVTSYMSGVRPLDLPSVRRAARRLRDVASEETPVVNQVLADVETELGIEH
jgi:ABC-type Mn2+/Zn2+ transport system ATPase subunit